MKNRVFKNGNFYTFDESRIFAKGLLTAGNKILKVFWDDNFSIPKDAEVIDLNGKCVLPGFTDSHIHLGMFGQLINEADLSEAKSEEECIVILHNKYKNIKKGEWIFGRRWGHNLWKVPNLPTKKSLDTAFPENPVILLSRCHHLLWTNSTALKILEIDENTNFRIEAEVERDSGRKLTGIFKESSADLVASKSDKFRSGDIKTILKSGFKELHKYGITAVHTPEDIDIFNALQQLHLNNELSIRTVFYFPLSLLNDIINLKINSGYGNEWLKIGGIKLFIDGSLGGRTALMLEPFENEPENLGISFLSKQELIEILKKINDNNLAAKVHAIGDKAVRQCLEAFIEINENKKPAYRIQNRIEHFQLIKEEDIRLLKKTAPVASMQPAHLVADYEPANKFWGDRSRYAYAFKSILENNGMLLFGSDAPVEPVNPFLGIYAAVLRRDVEGLPFNGWYPQERISLTEAVKAYTYNPAFFMNEHNYRGSIKENNLADFIVLNKNVFEIPNNEIKDIKVLMTIIDGEIVYSA